MDRDLARSAALASACAAFISVPNVGALIGDGEKTAQYDTVITPPDYAFAVWAPLFGACLVDTVLQCRTEARHLPSSCATGWPLAGAYGLNALWSVASQTDRFALTPALLPSATALTALAFGRLQVVPDPARSTAWAAGALLGWTSLASTVNVVAGAQLLGAKKDSRRSIAASVAGLCVATTGVAGVVGTSSTGGHAVASTACWGLISLAATPGKPTAIRVVAGAGAAVLGAISARSRSRRST